MTSKRNELPPPDMSKTDMDATLRKRISINGAPSTPAPTQVRTGTDASQAGTGTSRPDPPGMRRYSLYVTQKAAVALDEATDRVLESLAPGTPRHVALSALLEAAAANAGAVTRALAEQQADELATRLAALKKAAT